MPQYLPNSQRFLTDDRFWAWVKDPTDVDINQFWQEYQLKNPEQCAQIAEARKVALYSISQADSLSKNEMTELWQRISHTIQKFNNQ